MIERRVETGQTYCVTPSVDCTVATADGTELVNVAAGSQDYFVAPAATVMVSDAGARLTASRNPAWLASRNPAWLAELRAGLDELGVVYKLAWMAAGEKLVVHTDRLDDTQLEQVTALLERVLPQNIEVVRYNHHIEYTYNEYMKYSSAKSLLDVIAINPNYMDDVTPSGVWAFNTDNMTNAHFWGSGHCGQNTWQRMFYKANNIRKLYLSLPKVTYDAHQVVSYCDNLEELECFHNGEHFGSIRDFPKLKRAKLNAPKAHKLDSALTNCPQIEEWEIIMDWENLTIFNGSLRIAQITKWDIPLPKCNTFEWSNFTSRLTSWGVDMPSLKYGHNGWNACTLDKPSVLRICNSIPAWDDGATHQLGLGIHVDHKTDEGVLAAISNAEAKGWTVTVQWKGTPTSTASTLSFGQLIYAKVGEHELPDGTTERMLDWGHYVTDPTGYETFRSLESAYEFFGLEMPQQENED